MHTFEIISGVDCKHMRNWTFLGLVILAGGKSQSVLNEIYCKMYKKSKTIHCQAFHAFWLHLYIAVTSE